ncbi:hypothetical protein BR1R3_50910 [Pseudomonas atacamensis]|jgi:hypothetical protein|nr:hypothetical protein BR1R3_50910 [Pseudomonas atacamensis]
MVRNVLAAILPAKSVKHVAPHELNGPTFAYSIVTTQELIEALAVQE